ncbi:MAG: two-component sensor histidine kinase [Alteromonadaceae bacterium]|nr:two-component sensor histidine kinase [Alteromonadaceae bacterium]MBH85497.1 two-component sensor histidine kinase [Alteromonadaceae bacterium]|tara:strand:+ start:53053 stop:54447 length:1395 start_codon:yes stop_codon:yes gene_type:complete
MSLTRTLTLTVTGLMLLMVLIAATWSYFESNHELEEVFDAELAQSARMVQGLVRHLARSQSLDELTASLEDTLQLPAETDKDDESDEILPNGAGHKYEKKIAFQIWSSDASPLLTSAALTEQSERPQIGYAWAESGGYQWRTFTLRDPQTGLWVLSAQREDIRSELSGELAMGNVLPLVVVLPVLLASLVVAIQWAFRPLRKLEQPVRNMAPERIHPLDEKQAPREVNGLVNAVNGLLRRLDQALDRERQFSADAAHELRTPLTALRLNLESACERNPEQFGELLTSVDRMNYLVEQMLLLSRIDSGTRGEPQLVSLSEIVAQSVADVAPLALREKIELSLDDHIENDRVLCHSALIATLVRSLTANAIQYSPSGSPVGLQLSERGPNYLLKICDRGPGIPEKARQRATQRFVRLDQRQGSGAGLGLAIATRIAEIHGGRLSLENREDGLSGLCVVVLLALTRI